MYQNFSENTDLQLNNTLYQNYNENTNIIKFIKYYHKSRRQLTKYYFFLNGSNIVEIKCEKKKEHTSSSCSKNLSQYGKIYRKMLHLESKLLIQKILLNNTPFIPYEEKITRSLPILHFFKHCILPPLHPTIK